MEYTNNKWQPKYGQFDLGRSMLTTFCGNKVDNSKYVLSQCQDLEMLLFPELMGNRAKDTSTNQLAFVVHKDYCVVIKLDLAAVIASSLHSSTDNHSIDNISFFNLTTRLCFLDGSNYSVPQPCSFFPSQ
uniref:TIDP3222 n=1 Tax=Arundo donax TaxID=35708 RepID=A0A0A9HNX9_ARUDO